MIVTVTDEMRRKFTKDGSVLKRFRSIGGLPMGIAAGGITFIIFAVLMYILFAALDVLGIAMFFGVLLGVPGIILFLAGMAAHRKRVRCYRNYFLPDFDMEEIDRIDRELLEPDTVLITNTPGKKDFSLDCFITKHYLVLPLNAGRTYVRRIEDMVAVAYSEAIPGFGGYKHGLAFLSLGTTSPGCNGLLSKDTCMEIVRIMQERNPRIITDQKFFFEGKAYDLYQNWQDVIQLFQTTYNV